MIEIESNSNAFRGTTSSTTTTHINTTSGSGSTGATTVINTSCSTSSSTTATSNNNSSSCSNNNNCNVNNTKFIEACDFIKTVSNALMVLDCRILKDYESKHIKDSIHINCRDKITRSRLSTKKLSVKDIISCEKTKKKIEQCVSSPAVVATQPQSTVSIKPLIVLYDESTCDENDLVLDQNPLRIVLENITCTFKTTMCRILKGGFKEFSNQYPDHCVHKEKQINTAACLSQQLADFNCEETYKFSIENAQMSEIVPNLYLGNECDARNEDNLKRKGITYIINVTKNIPCFYESNEQYKYKRIAVNDACNQNLKQYFDETNEFIDEALKVNAKVLVHCQAGISRSPTIVIAYLMKKYGYDWNKAYNKVKEIRSIVGPNIMFLSQLIEYEKQLSNVKTAAAASTTSTTTTTNAVPVAPIKNTLANTINLAFKVAGIPFACETK